MFGINFARTVGERTFHNVTFSLGNQSGVSLDVRIKDWDTDRFCIPRVHIFLWAPFNPRTNRFELLGNLVQIHREARGCCSNGWGFKVL